MAANYGHVLVGNKERKIISVEKVPKFDELFTNGKGVFVFQVIIMNTHLEVWLALS